MNGNPLKRVNYDQIAPSYDVRYQANQLVGVENALLDLARKINPRKILEVGCGTGRWLASLSPIAQQVFGVDLSLGMLGQTTKRSPGVHLACGRAGKLPFSDHSFDMVFCVNALHHFDDPRGFITGGKSLLNPGGCLTVVGQVPQDRRNCWFVYDYFEGTYETDLKRFNTWCTVKDWMVSVGFEHIDLKTVEHLIDHKYGRDILDDPFLKKDAVSQLTLLTDQAYAEGIQRIKTDIERAEAGGKILEFQVELRLDMLTGFKVA